MSDRDSQNAPIDAADLRLVEALYGEGPADDVDDVELASLSDLRAMFRDLPEQEPSSAITAKLMSAAAEAVKARTPTKRGWWARLVALFEPIGAHPALAAAASLVLVVAVGGVLALTGRSEVAEPKVTDEKVAAEGVAADSPPPPPATGEQEAAEPASEETKDAESIVGAGLPPSTTPPPTSTPSRATAIEDQTRRRAREEARREKLDRARADVRNSGGKGKTGLDFSGSALDGNVDDTDEAPEPDGDFKSADKAPSEAPAMQKQQARRTDAEVEGLTAKGRQAASKGDCAAVRKYGARVQKLDSDHYRDVYRRDAKINACYQSRKQAPNSFK